MTVHYLSIGKAESPVNLTVEELPDGRVAVSGHRWRVDIVTAPTEFDREPGARSVVALVAAAAGGDDPTDHGGLGQLAGPTEMLAERIKVYVGRGGLASSEDGRGGDGVALILTRW